MKIGIVDIDGVIINPIKRLQAATIDGKIDWDKALNSNALYLDELIPQAVEHLATIRQHYQQIILLTSRYDHMRKASEDWLKNHGITQYDRAIFKPWDTERFTKTKEWKADEVLKILQEASQPGLWRVPSSPISDLLIVEDDESNREEIRQEVARYLLSKSLIHARYFLSLQEAV